MNRLNKYLVATFLSAATFVTTAAQTMQVQVYERMSAMIRPTIPGSLSREPSRF